jgi:hypothetical protein
MSADICVYASKTVKVMALRQQMRALCNYEVCWRAYEHGAARLQDHLLSVLASTKTPLFCRRMPWLLRTVTRATTALPASFLASVQSPLFASSAVLASARVLQGLQQLYRRLPA